jgi:hypothetical protein
VKYASKSAFVERMEAEHERFLALAASIPRARYDEPGVWGEGWTIKDLFAHLTEWEQMFLGWHREGLAGTKPDMPAPGYKWNETAKLNHEIWAKHKDVSYRTVRTRFDRSYAQMRELVDGLTEPELLEPGRFAWTGKHPLTTYLGANTASHYSAASKILKRWIREQGLTRR